ncbi:MAG: CBS domain-containing protein [Candidatus Calditenuis sp.]|jgi:CBS domain-containing protein|nr:CBS domain-containing protein [Candidatus Calditenuis sp.]MDT7968165.1 CBS domain-containing protein [Candidatus Calditenuis sp.]
MSGEGEIPKIKVRDVMIPAINVIEAERTVREACIMMDRLGVGSLLVEREGKLVGIVTERDFVVRVLATGLDHTKTKVGDVMSYPVIAVSPDSPIEEAVALMLSHGFRRLPVVDLEGKLLGMVTLSEAAKALLAYQKAVTEVLEVLIKAVKTKDEVAAKSMYG